MCKIVNKLKVCSDCSKVLNKMEEAQKSLKSKYIDCSINYDGEAEDDEFSNASCDCCNSSLAGKRYSYSVVEIGS